MDRALEDENLLFDVPQYDSNSRCYFPFHAKEEKRDFEWWQRAYDVQVKFYRGYVWRGYKNLKMFDAPLNDEGCVDFSWDEILSLDQEMDELYRSTQTDLQDIIMKYELTEDEIGLIGVEEIDEYYNSTVKKLTCLTSI